MPDRKLHHERSLKPKVPKVPPRVEENPLPLEGDDPTEPGGDAPPPTKPGGGPTGDDSGNG